jgi:hypothetical protein
METARLTAAGLRMSSVLISRRIQSKVGVGLVVYFESWAIGISYSQILDMRRSPSCMHRSESRSGIVETGHRIYLRSWISDPAGAAGS